MKGFLNWQSIILLSYLSSSPGLEYYSPGSYQRLDLFIKVLRVLCLNLKEIVVSGQLKSIWHILVRSSLLGLVFWNSIHLEVASDSFCFLINSSWLLVFILYVFFIIFSGFNLYCWKGILIMRDLLDQD